MRQDSRPRRCIWAPMPSSLCPQPFTMSLSPRPFTMFSVPPLFACLYRPPAAGGVDVDRRGDVGDVLAALAYGFSPRYQRLRDDLVSIDVSGLERLIGP